MNIDTISLFLRRRGEELLAVAPHVKDKKVVLSKGGQRYFVHSAYRQRLTGVIETTKKHDAINLFQMYAFMEK